MSLPQTARLAQPQGIIPQYDRPAIRKQPIRLGSDAPLGSCRAEPITSKVFARCVEYGSAR